MANTVLDSLSAPYLSMMTNAGTTELVINDPDNVYLEINGQWKRVEPNPNQENLFKDLALQTFIKAVNAHNEGALSDTSPLFSGTLSSGERIQIAIPPAVESPTLAIRRQDKPNINFDDYLKDGFFSRVNEHMHREWLKKDPLKLTEEEIAQRLINAAVNKQNIIISGGTGSGKTTFMNALCRHIPHTERIITIEDAREIHLEQPNKVHLLKQRMVGKDETETYNFEDLLRNCMRLKPDRIFAAELRGEEAFTFLNSANTGHPGTITTVHANNCIGVFNRLIFMMSSATRLSTEALEQNIRDTVDIIVQIHRFDDKRYMTGILHKDQYIITKN